MIRIDNLGHPLGGEVDELDEFGSSVVASSINLERIEACGRSLKNSHFFFGFIKLFLGHFQALANAFVKRNPPFILNSKGVGPFSSNSSFMSL